MARNRRRSRRPDGPAERRSHETNSVLAGVAARMAEVIELIRAGRWHAPSYPAGDDPQDRPLADDDEGGFAASGVRKMPPDKSGPGSAALVEPDD